MVEGRDGDTYTIDGVRYPRLTRILQRRSAYWIDQWRKRVGEEADRVTREAADFGTRLHALTALYDTDDIAGLTEALLAEEDPRVLLGLETWVAWEKRAGVVWVPGGVEVTVVSKKYGFAGTADRVGRMPAERALVIVDKKTGTLGDVVGYQLTGYKIAWNEGHKGREKVDRLIAVRIPRESPEKVQTKEYQSDKYVAGLLDDIDMYRKTGGMDE